MYAELTQRGLSAQTIQHTHRVLSEALSHGVQWGMVGRNVAALATPPRPQRRRQEMWDARIINRFLEVSKDSRFHDIYQLAVLTGMRRGELVGLKWESVDLENGQLNVVNTLQRIDGIGLVEGQPKTPLSNRRIAISVRAQALLRNVRTRQLEQRLQAGPMWEKKGFVFTQANGRPVEPGKVTNDFSKIVRVNDLPGLTLKGLRHAHATLLLVAGVPAKVVSERLGHSNIGITMDIYSHVMPEMQEEAVKAFDEALRDNKMPTIAH